MSTLFPPSHSLAGMLIFARYRACTDMRDDTGQPFSLQEYYGESYKNLLRVNTLLITLSFTSRLYEQWLPISYILPYRTAR